MTFLDSHIGAELRTVVYVAGLAEGRIGTGNVVVVAAEYDGLADFSFLDCFIKCGSNFCAAFSVSIRMRA